MFKSEGLDGLVPFLKMTNIIIRIMFIEVKLK